MSTKPKNRFVRKFFCVIMVLALVSATFSVSAAAGGSKENGTNYPFVFVAGYAGYGQYDKMNGTFQYWGMRSGDLLKYLNAQGFECYAASVDPIGSAWDRACELYAQLTGGIVDYGEAHAAQYNHSRFGTDYSKNPLITDWGTTNTNGGLKKVNLLGHSFGGTTIRLLSELLANGSPEEMKSTSAGAVSGLFSGGKGDWINSITTLASPHNGSTVLNLASYVKWLLPAGNRKVIGISNPTPFGLVNYVYNMSKLLNNGIGEDTGAFDLTLDGAALLNEKLSPVEGIYYFSFSTDATAPARFSNKRIPDSKLADLVFLPTCLYMGRITGVTPGGIAYDESWFNNDGIVNTISSKAPANEAQKAFDAGSITPGVWHIMPTFIGDHASIIGGFIRAVDVHSFYVAQLTLINAL